MVSPTTTIIWEIVDATKQLSKIKRAKTSPRNIMTSGKFDEVISVTKSQVYRQMLTLSIARWSVHSTDGSTISSSTPAIWLLMITVTQDLFRYIYVTK